MLKLASDADVPGNLIRALKNSGVDLLRVQSVHEEGTPDPQILEWAAVEGRVLLTRDRSTMIGFALQRVRDNLLLPGLIVVSTKQSVGDAEREILMIIACCSYSEMANRIVYLPLQLGDLKAVPF